MSDTNNKVINELLNAQDDNKDSFLKKLDYSLTTSEQRNNFVKTLIKDVPQEQLTNKVLEVLSNYIIFANNKDARRRNILTGNRMVTVDKRETSFQGLAESLESGEDGIYNMIANDKNILFTPKLKITQEDVENIPGLKEIKEEIENIKIQCSQATGKRKFLLKQQLINLYQTQYMIKISYTKPITFCNGIKNFSKFSLDEKIILNEEQKPISSGLITFFDSKHIAAILANYSKLKEDAYSKFWTDSYYMMRDLDSLIEKTLKDAYPMYYDILIWKIDKLTNKEIQDKLMQYHNTEYTVEYISSLWKNKIPKLLSKQAEEDYIVWYFTIKKKGKWKKCSCCGQIKLAHNFFFSKNKSSKDGYYSLCKICRNKRRKEKK